MSWIGWLVVVLALPVEGLLLACLIFGPRAVAETLNRWADRIDPEGRDR